VGGGGGGWGGGSAVSFVGVRGECEVEVCRCAVRGMMSRRRVEVFVRLGSGGG